MVQEHVGEIVSLLFMAFALGMDAFSVSLGMGMQLIRLKRIAFIGIVIGVQAPDDPYCFDFPE